MRRGRSPSPEQGPSSSTASKLSAGKPLQQRTTSCCQTLYTSGVQRVDPRGGRWAEGHCTGAVLHRGSARHQRHAECTWCWAPGLCAVCQAHRQMLHMCIVHGTDAKQIHLMLGSGLWPSSSGGGWRPLARTAASLRSRRARCRSFSVGACPGASAAAATDAFLAAVGASAAPFAWHGGAAPPGCLAGCGPVPALAPPSSGSAVAARAAAAPLVESTAGAAPLQLSASAAARSTARVESSRCAWMQVSPSSSAIALMPGTCNTENREESQWLNT